MRRSPLTCGGSTKAQFVWTAVSRPSDVRVQVVLEHLLANRVGGW